MKILNVKLGHSTNSSSSHSMIYAPNARFSDVDAFEDYGWGCFTLASEQAKLNYFANMVVRQLDLPQWMVPPMLNALTNGGGVACSIDHQSTYNFPGTFGNPEKLNVQFLQEYSDYLKRPEIIILGGNDNGDDHPYKSYGQEISTNFGDMMRKDGDWWVRFDRKTGNRIIMSFIDNPKPLDRSITPMLVDVKITDYCPYDCPMCYMNSTVAGTHASMASIEAFVQEAVDCQVFEVAIGGGEPTLHPHFNEILNLFKSAGINANFTTRNLTWANNYNPDNTYTNYADSYQFKAFAVSVYSVEEIEQLAAHENKRQIVLHIVMGTVDMPTFSAMMRAAAKHVMPVTLLGYKMVGRGDKFKQYDYSNWIECLGASNDYTQYRDTVPYFSIDTALAKTSLQQLKDLGIPEYMYFVKEGKYSCYVDLVNNKIAPSSFCDKDKYFDYTNLRDDWNKIEMV